MKQTISLLLVLVLLFGLLTGCSAQNKNTYETPVRLEYELLYTNVGSDLSTYCHHMFNGFTEQDMQIVLAVHIAAEDIDFDVSSSFPDDHKCTYDILSKKALNEEALTAFEEKFDFYAEMFSSSLMQLSFSGYDNIANDLGICKEEAKSLIGAMENISEQWASAKITEGYVLNVEYTYTGSTLDEAQRIVTPTIVFNVNGRWISYKILQVAENILGDDSWSLIKFINQYLYPEPL